MACLLLVPSGFTMGADRTSSLLSTASVTTCFPLLFDILNSRPARFVWLFSRDSVLEFREGPGSGGRRIGLYPCTLNNSCDSSDHVFFTCLYLWWKLSLSDFASSTASNLSASNRCSCSSLRSAYKDRGIPGNEFGSSAFGGCRTFAPKQWSTMISEWQTWYND